MHLDLLPYMKAAERFTGIDPFRVNASQPDSGAIYPSQGTNGTIAASYNSAHTFFCPHTSPTESLPQRGIVIQLIHMIKPWSIWVFRKTLTR